MIKFWIYPLLIMGIVAIFVSSCSKDDDETTNTYNVIYDGNNYTSGSVPVDVNSYEAGATVTVLDNTGSLKNTSYSFADWNSASDGTGTYHASASTFIIGNTNVTLYANWIIGGKLKVIISDAYNFTGHTIYYSIMDTNTLDPVYGFPNGNIMGQGGLNIIDNSGSAITIVSSSDPTEKVFDNGTYYWYGMVDLNDNAPSMGYVADSGDKYGGFVTTVINGDTDLTLTEADFPLTM